MAGTYLFDVNYATETADQLNITGASSVDISGLTFVLGTELSPYIGETPIKVFQSNVATMGAFNVSGLRPDQSIVTFDGGMSFYLVVPEPASFSLVLIGGLLLLRRPSTRRIKKTATHNC